MFTKAATISQMVLFAGLFFAASIVLTNPLQATAQQAPEQNQKKPAPTTQQNEKKPAPAQQQNKPAAKSVTYNYVAQPGDSYSEMARKAVQTYGKKYNVKLTLGQILFAETNMTQQAGSPYLNQGQQISIQESTVKSWVEKAQKLDAATIALWNQYVPGVDFNTNDVGEK